MRVAGVELQASAVADLAVLLQNANENALAQYVGRAVDNNRPELGLGARERETMLGVLDDCPDNLVELRSALLKQRHR